MINVEKIIEHWLETAEHNLGTAEFLLQGKRYPECLFFCHLALEKVLKALVVQERKEHAPYIHNLVALAKLAKIKLSPKQVDELTTITEFNIAGRYNEVKYNFYKKSTKAYTEKYFKITKETYLWLKKFLQKK
ncbi:MAG: HEPN domain-containing protein [bacterium]